MKEEKEFIILTSNSHKIFYCSKCDRYIIIYMQEINKNIGCCCINCKYTYLQDIFIDEAKIYFNSKNSTKNIRYIGQNDNIVLGVQYHCLKHVNDIKDICENINSRST